MNAAQLFNCVTTTRLVFEISGYPYADSEGQATTYQRRSIPTVMATASYAHAQTFYTGELTRASCNFVFSSGQSLRFAGATTYIGGWIPSR